MHILCKINVCLLEEEGEGRGLGILSCKSALQIIACLGLGKKLMVDQWSGTRTGLTCDCAGPMLVWGCGKQMGGLGLYV